MRVSLFLLSLSMSVPGVCWADQGRNWLDLSFDSNPNLTQKGVAVSVGRVLGFWLPSLGADVRLRAGNTPYGAIQVQPDSSVALTATAPSAYDPDSEINRLRSDQDSWSYYGVEPGVMVAGYPFAGLLPQLESRGRLGVALGRFSDQANAITFDGLLVILEASLKYPLGHESRWFLTGALSWTAGTLLRQSEVPLSKNTRSLPVSWIGNSLGLSYLF